MERFSPKIEIINHFDNLINRIDIDIDSCLDKFNDQQLLIQLLRSSESDRRRFRNKDHDFYIEFFNNFNSSKNQTLDSWEESTKVGDYLKKVRMKTIEQLRKAQEETLEYYKLNSPCFKSELTKEKSIDELRSELFAEKFYFQVNFKQSEKRFWAFNVFIFVTDFYMSPFYIESLEKLINGEKEPFGRDSVFDNQIVLTGLLYKYFIDNLSNIPNHVIHVRKEYVSNIEYISFCHIHNGSNLISPLTIDLSNLVNLDLIDKCDAFSRKAVKFHIEGLTSLRVLQLGTKSPEIDFSINNLNLLIYLAFMSVHTIDQEIITKLLDRLQHIEQLHLSVKISYLNLTNFVNLKVLQLKAL